MNEMTSKERILNAIRGREIDRTPWCPFLAYYFEHLPREIQRKGQVAYLQELGADPLLRGFHKLFSVKEHNCEISWKEDGWKKYAFYETKVGTLTEEYTYSPEGKSLFLTGHAVKTEEDFKILQYMVEHVEITENCKAFERDYELLGENGLYLPVLGLYMKTAFQALVEKWCGTMNLTYALYDFPEVVEECLAVMQEKDRKTVEISLQSSAEGFIFWEDSSTTNISPEFFARYTAPQINAWGERIHSEDKLLIHHACGHIKDLLPLMVETEIDMIESISPPPTGNIEIAEALKWLPEHIGIIGGIEPVFFESCSMEALKEYVEMLLGITKEKRFVLGNSDSCPPKVACEKFKQISEWVKG